MKAGRKKQTIKRAVHSIKVSALEYELVKRFIKLLRDGGAVDVVLQAVDGVDVLDGGILPAPDGERKKTTIAAYQFEWVDIQKFVTAVIRCSNRDRAVIIEALEGGERLTGVDAVYVLLHQNKSGMRLMADNLPTIRQEFINLLAELGVEDIERHILTGEYTAEGCSIKLIKADKGKYIEL